VRGRSSIYLAGPPLVKAAIGEDADEESLGGAELHAGVTGLGEYLADDDAHAIDTARTVVDQMPWDLAPPARTFAAPRWPVEQLIGVVPADERQPYDPREVIARLVDGSDFLEFKAGYGADTVCGHARLHGHAVGLVANHGPIQPAGSTKVAQFIQLCDQSGTALVFLQNTTGYMVGKEYEQAGMIKDGAKMINVVTNSAVPHLTVIMGASYGAGNYGMCGRAYGPRFLFAWPNSKMAVMGPQQLAGVLSIVARQSAAAAGREFDEEADARQRQTVEEQIERESHAFFNSGRIYDDGIIDPRDTRTVLGIALSALHSNEVRGRRGFGVFRM
jgi:geranyl-CoA carboxylase beta subunit